MKYKFVIRFNNNNKQIINDNENKTRGGEGEEEIND
jgi:hypothetical protein